VGGKNLLPMKTLTGLFADAGCGEVRTYIQSGNVVFTAAPRLADELSSVISVRIQESLGLSVPVVLRTEEEMERIATSNPFRQRGVPEDITYVMFLANKPASHAVASLDPDRSPGDEFILQGSEIYLHLRKGAATTKLTNAYFDSKLKTVSTARNWRTVLKLRDMTTTR
jgi:uncharacterized protein (DUF1697 family)